MDQFLLPGSHVNSESPPFVKVHVYTIVSVVGTVSGSVSVGVKTTSPAALFSVIPIQSASGRFVIFGTVLMPVSKVEEIKNHIEFVT